MPCSCASARQTGALRDTCFLQTFLTSRMWLKNTPCRSVCRRAWLSPRTTGELSARNLCLSCLTPRKCVRKQGQRGLSRRRCKQYVRRTFWGLAQSFRGKLCVTMLPAREVFQLAPGLRRH